jgi:peptide chain release factor
MPEFAVSDEKNRRLAEQMAAAGLREEDLEERFIRSSGKGGQHVNKSSTCVYLKHRPTGIEVKCMVDRSQSVNRFLARRELVERLQALAGKPTAREKEAERLKRQKARRKRKSAAKHAGRGEGDGEGGVEV